VTHDGGVHQEGSDQIKQQQANGGPRRPAKLRGQGAGDDQGDGERQSADDEGICNRWRCSLGAWDFQWKFAGNLGAIETVPANPVVPQRDAASVGQEARRNRVAPFYIGSRRYSRRVTPDVVGCRLGRLSSVLRIGGKMLSSPYGCVSQKARSGVYQLRVIDFDRTLL